MTQEAITILTAELMVVWKQAEYIAEKIDQMSRVLSVERQSLWQLIEEHDAKRVELFKQELQARGMTWCTYCSAIISENETKILLIEGREKYPGDYENVYYGFRIFSKLHRVCSTCYDGAVSQHERGTYGTQRDRVKFYAFCVKKHENGCYYVRRFNVWEQIEEDDCLLDEPSGRLVDELSNEWHLPPRIEIKSEWSNKLLMR